MKKYFYSKFDNINWSWWDPESITSENKSVLENINRQLKSYFPSNLLIYYYNNDTFILISERFQIDRDNAGRAFSFRNFSIADKSEIKTNPNWVDFLQGFNGPSDYHSPESIETPLIINNSYNTNKQELIFGALLDHCINGNKICIKNDDISKDNRKPNKDINALNFNNFPDGSLFLATVCLLPFTISKQISFCFNYEDEFININDGKLSFIDIIFCGDKSIVVDTFHVDEKINFDSIARQGFKINDISNPAKADLQWSKLFSFLTDENYKESAATLNFIYEKYCQRITNKSVQELTSIYFEIYKLLNLEDNVIGDIEFVQKLITLPGLPDTTKKLLLRSYLIKADFVYTLNHLYELLILCDRFGLIEELDAKILNSNVISVISKADLANIINNNDFGELSKSSKRAISSGIASKPLEIIDLLNDHYFNAFNKASKVLKSDTNFDYLWNELDKSGMDFTETANNKLIKQVYKLTGNEQEYNKFIEKQYHKTSDAFWLDEIRKSNFKINLQLNNPIDSLDDCLFYWNKINGNSKEVFERVSTLNVYNSIVKYINSVRDIAALGGFLFKHYNDLQNFANSNVEYSLAKIISDRVSKLFVELLDTNTNEFNVIKESIKNDHASRKGLKFIFIHTPLLISLNVNSKVKIIRVLDILKACSIEDVYKTRWLSNVFSKGNLNSNINDESESIANKFKKSIVEIDGWKTINSTYINELKADNKLRDFLLHFNKKRVLLLSAFIFIFIFAIFVINYFFNEPSNLNKTEDNFSAVTDTTNKTVNVVDSNKLLMIEAEQFLNKSFFESANDTLTFFQFVQRRKEIDFIKFSFDYADFSKYTVKKVDTVLGNVMWNKFVGQYNDSLIKLIELQTIHAGTDSFSKIYKIKILLK